MKTLEILEEINREISLRESTLNTLDSSKSAFAYVEGSLDSLRYTKFLIISKMNADEIAKQFEKG